MSRAALLVCLAVVAMVSLSCRAVPVPEESNPEKSCEVCFFFLYFYVSDSMYLVFNCLFVCLSVYLLLCVTLCGFIVLFIRPFSSPFIPISFFRLLVYLFV